MSDVNEFNAETNQYILRPYTEEELEQLNIDRSLEVEVEVSQVVENPLITSALLKLQSLGLTEEEAKAIAGI